MQILHHGLLVGAMACFQGAYLTACHDILGPKYNGRFRLFQSKTLKASMKVIMPRRLRGED